MTPELTVLHLAGSSDTRFYFECSFLYGKAACRFEGHRGDELLADACIDRLGLIEAKRLSAL